MQLFFSSDLCFWLGVTLQLVLIGSLTCNMMLFIGVFNVGYLTWGYIGYLTCSMMFGNSLVA